ncbi:hypothetical protein GBF38_012599 [Nibea albiflora]|uniref:Uncharacterized protein n=1 Tax=Nibea albiflora TaxID=240163 RepID=A0ACB7EJC0_NIBAL|nr:hypothetical protein GBF38_012599 [Nibea albiflora]
MDIITREVTERINSVLWRHSGGTKGIKPPTNSQSNIARRRQLMVKHIVSFLKNGRDRPSFTLCIQVQSSKPAEKNWESLIEQDSLLETGQQTTKAPSMPSESSVRGKKMISVIPASVLRPVISDEENISDLSDEDSEELSEEDSEELSDEEDKNSPPIFQPITGSTNRSQPTEPAELLYTEIAKAVVNRILKGMPVLVPVDERQEMVSMLKHKLCSTMAGHALTRALDVEKTVKAVLKNMPKKMRHRSLLAMNLLSQHPSFYVILSDIIKKQLLKPKGKKGFFNSLFKGFIKPLKKGLKHEVVPHVQLNTVLPASL